MLEFHIDRLSCGHCVNAITTAIRAIDPQAIVTADLNRKQVGIESTRASAQALLQSLAQAGYPAVATQTAATRAERPNGPAAQSEHRVQSSGGCCGARASQRRAYCV